VATKKKVSQLLLASNRQHLLSSSHDKTMRMWNIQRGSCVRIFKRDLGIFDMVWFKENVVAAGDGDREIKFWNISTGEHLKTLVGDQDIQTGLVVNSEGMLISYGMGNGLSFWSNE